MELNRIEQTRRKLLEQGKKIINLSSGNAAEFGVRFPEQILTKAFAEFQKNPVYKADPKGDLHAREAVQNFYKKRGFIVHGENILLTSGTSESYLHILKVLSKNTSGVPDSQTEVLFPNPIYPLFEHIAELAGVKVRYYDLDAGKTAQVNTNVDWQIDLENLESKITPQTRAIVLVSPNNPTGSVLSEKTLESVLNIAQKHSISIVSDEVFSEFIFDGKKFPRIAEIAQNHAANVNIFTLNGISKTYALPGLKLSWVAATGPNTEDFIDQIELSVDTLLATNQISQAMLPTIMNDGEVFLSEFKKRLEESRNRAVKILEKNPKYSFHKPEGGFYLFAEIKNYKGTDEDFCIELLERENIFVHPGYFYDYEKGLYILISFLMEPDELCRILNKI